MTRITVGGTPSTYLAPTSKHETMDWMQKIGNDETTIVDVRTPGEFMGGHVEGSVNIPLNELPGRLDEVKAMEGTVVLCCASGNRSGQATQWLRAQGLDDVHNGGGWMQVNGLLAQTAD